MRVVDTFVSHQEEAKIINFPWFVLGELPDIMNHVNHVPLVTRPPTLQAVH